MTHLQAAPDRGAVTAAGFGAWTLEARQSFRLAWPLIIAQLAQNLLFTTDVVLMGWLGPKYLAAGTLAGAFLMPFMIFGVGVIGAVAPLVAQARGRRRIKEVRRIVRQGFWASIAGTATVDGDVERKKAFWSKTTEAFFGESKPEDPDIVLLRVTPETGQYWDSPGLPATAVEVLKGMTSKKPARPGESHEVDL